MKFMGIIVRNTPGIEHCISFFPCKVHVTKHLQDIDISHYIIYNEHVTFLYYMPTMAISSLYEGRMSFSWFISSLLASGAFSAMISSSNMSAAIQAVRKHEMLALTMTLGRELAISDVFCGQTAFHTPTAIARVDREE